MPPALLLRKSMPTPPAQPHHPAQPPELSHPCWPVYLTPTPPSPSPPHPASTRLTSAMPSSDTRLPPNASTTVAVSGATSKSSKSAKSKLAKSSKSSKAPAAAAAAAANAEKTREERVGGPAGVAAAAAAATGAGGGIATSGGVGGSGVGGAACDYVPIWPHELAERLRCSEPPPPMLLDCRPFGEYTRSHIRGALHVNCSDRLSRRRLAQGKLRVTQLVCPAAAGTADGPAGATEDAAGGSAQASSTSAPAAAAAAVAAAGPPRRDMVLYDGSSGDPAAALKLVLESLRREGADPLVLRGGLSDFRALHESLCEHHGVEDVSEATSPFDAHVNGRAGALLRSSAPLDERSGATSSTATTARSQGFLAAAGAVGGEVSQESSDVSRLLPYLFVGGERAARDLPTLRRLNVGLVLNVTAHVPHYHAGAGSIAYRRLPASDTHGQDLRQYFRPAFLLIEEARRCGCSVLLHCQAGVSRSPTVAIAYVMRLRGLGASDAYAFVRARRAAVAPNLSFMGQLLLYERELAAERSAVVSSPAQRALP
ncbi:dual specificity protein phosphatase 10-like [Petromyzon marinus]|uniref:dual specificity protein phosphatase 10-like n=1 Tax=Petromyzon marinus TaxID=7757 RepID=UPI003F6F3611